MCARTQFMTGSFLWAERPIMSKTNETMKHNASATAYYKRVSAAPLTFPDGTSVKYSYKTLEKWKSLYSTGGLDALMPVSRSDKAHPVH